MTETGKEETPLDAACLEFIMDIIWSVPFQPRVELQDGYIGRQEGEESQEPLHRLYHQHRTSQQWVYTWCHRGTAALPLALDPQAPAELGPRDTCSLPLSRELEWRRDQGEG